MSERPTRPPAPAVPIGTAPPHAQQPPLENTPPTSPSLPPQDLNMLAAHLLPQSYQTPTQTAAQPAATQQPSLAPAQAAPASPQPRPQPQQAAAFAGGGSGSIEGMQTLLLRIDRHGRIVYANTALARYLGIAKQEITNQPKEILRKFFGTEILHAINPSPDHPQTQQTVNDDTHHRILDVRTTLRSGVLDVVMQDVTSEERFRSYVQKYLPASIKDLSEDELLTFRIPERRFMTVSFTDLRGFTAMSEKMSPEVVRSTVNSYLEEMIGSIETNGATVDKIVGDEVMALYGAPRYFADHAFRAIKTAADQMLAMQKLQRDFQSRNKQMPSCGIGVHSGEMVVGNIGSSTRQNYTVMGTNVNLASRLCSVARPGEILTTQATLKALLDHLPQNWEAMKTRSPEEADLSDISGKLESITPLSENFKGLTYLLGPSVMSNPDGALYRLTYLYAFKAKGLETPIPVISITPTSTSEQASGKVEFSRETIETSHSERIFGKYRLIELIGRGGMGEVWKAKDSFDNTLAVKMLISGEGASESQLRRFKREAEVMARLQHRNICRIYEVGEVDRMHFIAMEYIEGASLSEIMSARTGDSVRSGTLSLQSEDLASIISMIQEEKSVVSQQQPQQQAESMGVEGREVGMPLAPELSGRSQQYRILPFQQTLTLMNHICEAIQFAHEHGILHRDLKPANILIRPDGEPVVMDFGLAKMQEDQKDTSLSVSGQIVGTIEYMAPEQAQSSKQVDERADIYSLGAVLYQLLTGKKHFVSTGNILSDAQKLQDYEPPRPSSINKMIDPDLEVVTLKALRADPVERYRSASAFREDLERCRKGDIISAKDVTAREVAIKWVRKNKALASVIAASTLAIIGGTAVFMWMLIEARNEALDAMKRAEANSEQLQVAFSELQQKNEAIQKANASDKLKQANETYWVEGPHTASELLEQALSNDSSLAGGWFLKGQLDVLAGRVKEAIGHFTKARKLEAGRYDTRCERLIGVLSRYINEPIDQQAQLQMAVDLELEETAQMLLREMLLSKDPSVQKLVSEEAFKGKAGIIHALVRSTSDRDPVVASRAIEMLQGQLLTGNQEVETHLRALASTTTDPSVRTSVNKVLASYENPTVESILPGTSHPDPKVRKYCFDRLFKMKVPFTSRNVLEALHEGGKDPDESIRMSVSRFLGTLATDGNMQALRILVELARSKDPMILKSTAAGLAQPAESVEYARQAYQYCRAQIKKLLGNQGNGGSESSPDTPSQNQDKPQGEVEALMAQMRDPNATKRIQAFQQLLRKAKLGELDPASTQQILTWGAQVRDDIIREMTIETLAISAGGGDAQSIQILSKTAMHSIKKVRDDAFNALGSAARYNEQAKEAWEKLK